MVSAHHATLRDLILNTFQAVWPALDAFGNAYVVGNTTSSDYPTTTGAFDTTGTGSDAIITKLSQLGSCSAASYSASTGSPFSAGNDPRAVAIGDFDGDGKQDLAIADAGTNSVSVLLGDGTGNFGTATGFATDSGPGSVVVADFNGDGKPDLVTADLFAGNVSLLAGDGTGNFSAATNVAVGISPQFVAAGDFDGDGKPDLAVPNNTSNNVAVLLDSCGSTTSNTIVVTNTNDSGAGSLRQAIVDSNSTAGTKETITFNIPGGGLQTISPTSALPTITEPVVIDGYTQPGASRNTLATGDNAVIEIELDGTSAGSTVSGLVITGGSSTVRGLVINRFGGPGIELQTGGGNAVAGNFIGTNAAGLAAVANGLDGIADFSVNNIIGGTGAGARNVIAGNGRFGIFLNASASGTVIQGNFVGVGSDGATALGHPTQGILNNGSSNVTVGGTAAGAGNIIAHNQGGVFIHSGTGNAVLGNSIFANGSGIDLDDDGVTPNDLGDADTGANNLQNFPVLTSAVSNGVTTTIAGTLNSTANTTFRVEFFSNPACAASGNGEGQTFLGSTGVTTDGSGNVSVSVTFNVGLPVGSVVTSTATDPAGNTSEFSACVPVVAPGTTFSISGHVADPTNNPLVGVNVHLGGSATGDVTTDPAGDYTFANLPQGGNFNLTPTEINFRFTPASTVVSNLQSNQTGINFKGQFINHTITGHVVDAQGNPLPGVTVTLAGSFSAVTHTDAQGSFSFPDIPENGSFVVTPERSSSACSPGARRARACS